LDALDGSYCTYSAYGETGDCTYSSCQDPSYPDNDPNAASAGIPTYKGQRQCGVFKPTNVISVSYSLPETILPAFYMERQCNEWMKLGMQGVTVVVASGDHGVGDSGNCNGNNYDIFVPYYIASCPYVLAVGATQLVTPAGQKPAPNQHLAERAAQWYLEPPFGGDLIPTGSGSGFSNVFAQPSYQKTAVTKYFSEVSLPFASYSQFVNQSNFQNITSGVYNKLGRAYPDVSAVGTNILITANGAWETVNGTSAATPLWAGILTLINEARLAAGKSTLGFINPTLYSNPQVFNDITVGNSVGCNTNGFPAAAGWDPATGLG
jgi:tripeptidyl-peptidase I